MSTPAESSFWAAPRQLGRSAVRVSPLGLAALSVRLGAPRGPGLAPSEVERAFHELGINTFLVTPEMRSLAQGVRLLVRSGHRQEITIISMASIPTGWTVRRAWEHGATALGVDYLDAFLLGWVQARWYVTGRTWPAMQALKEAGKVRALGFSCHHRPLAVELGRELGVDVLMIRYNAAHRGAEQEIFATLGDNRPGIISYTATRWGNLLSPLVDRGFAQGLPAADCYRFALSHPAVDVALCAAHSWAELCQDVAGVSAGPLSEARQKEVRAFGDAVHAAARGGNRWMFRQG
ncbi:MAG: aldo/keto reductase [Candidatus Schekmanbacteria bacterium]|nr:aldo/keto reductase [Candidatus Schekmanbacteria bacterium]